MYTVHIAGITNLLGNFLKKISTAFKSKAFYVTSQKILRAIAIISVFDRKINSLRLKHKLLLLRDIIM